MQQAGTNPRKKRRRKWLRRTLLTGAAVVTAAAAVPFVFTSALVRYYLAHSAYRNVPLRFQSATLSPMGQLTLFGLEIDDPGDAAGRRLLSAESVHVKFHWSALSDNHFQSVVVENLDLTLRPGADTPATILRLLTPATPGAGAAPTTPTATPAAFRCDEIIIGGNLRLEGYEPWLGLTQIAPNTPLPLQLVIGTTGATPVHQVSLIVGEDVTTQPYLRALCTVHPGTAATVLKNVLFKVGHLSPAVTDALLRIGPPLPPEWQRTASGYMEQLVVTGNAEIGRAVTLDAAVELHDFSLYSGTAGADGVEHLSAAMHVEGTLTPTPWQDLKFSGARCTWDDLQVANWRLQRGGANFAVQGANVLLTNFRADWGEAEVTATATYDTAQGLLTRGRLWVDDFYAQTLRGRLPDTLRQAFPDSADGLLSARIFLNESDAEHMAAFVQVVCPEEFTFNLPATVSPAPPSPWEQWRGKDAAHAGTSWWDAGGVPGAILTNAVLSGTLLWNRRPDSPPSLSRGRLTADELLVIPAAARASLEGTALRRIMSDFDLTRDGLWLEDLYADLPDNGQLEVAGDYVFAEGSLNDAFMYVNVVDLALVNRWLPAGFTLSGPLESAWKGGISSQSAALNMSLGVSSDVQIQGPDWKLAVLGVPTAALQLAYDREKGITQIQDVEISGLKAVQADAGFIKLLRQMTALSPRSTAGTIFDSLGGGAYLSLDQLGFSGHVGPTQAGGTISCRGLDLGSGATENDQSPALRRLTLQAEVTMALTAGYVPDTATLHLTGGKVHAQKLALGQNVFTDIAGDVAVDKGQATITQAAFSTAGSKFEGDATLRLAGQIDSLHLGFKGLQQQLVLRNLYPDVFMAEGPISGKITLQRAANGPLAGTIAITTDQPGRLKISRQASASSYAEVAKAAAQAKQAIVPENFGDIVMAQLEDYPYLTGKALLQDDAEGLQLVLEYARQPLRAGEPGYDVPVLIEGQTVRANVEFQLKGGTLTLHNSVTELLEQFLGFRNSLLARPKPTTASRPRP